VSEARLFSHLTDNPPTWDDEAAKKSVKRVDDHVMETLVLGVDPFATDESWASHYNQRNLEVFWAAVSSA
jgi:hypothetical protein